MREKICRTLFFLVHLERNMYDLHLFGVSVL